MVEIPVISSILFVIIGFTLFLLLTSLKARKLELDDDRQWLNDIVGFPLLGIIAIFGSATILTIFSLNDFSRLVTELISLTLLTLSVIQLMIYGHKIYKSEKSIVNRSNLIIISLSTILVFLIFSLIELNLFNFKLFQILLVIVALVITIFTIATGIALSGRLRNYIDHRYLTVDQRLTKGDKIVVYANPTIEGNIVDMTNIQL